MEKKEIKKEISCGIIPVFVNEKGEKEFFIVQHRDISKHFGFPKGHNEKNETYIQTAERELFEETGLRCSKIINDHVFTENYINYSKNPPTNKTNYFYIGFVEDKDVILQEEEIISSLWGSSEDVLEKLTFPEAKNILKKAIVFLEKKV